MPAGAKDAALRLNRVTDADAEAFLSLYRACLDHYGVGPSLPEIEAEILADLTAERGMSAEIAMLGDDPLGLAIWTWVYPAANGRALLLKELYVSSNARAQGVGRALMRHLSGIAMAEGAVRMEWGSFQPEAVAFYDRLGAARVPKVQYAVQAADLPDFAGRDAP